MANPQVTVTVGADTSQLESQLNNIGRKLQYSGGRYGWGNADGSTPPPTYDSDKPENKKYVQEDFSPLRNQSANDIRREIMARGALLVPGSTNFTQLMNAVAGQQRASIQGNINSAYDVKRAEIDEAKRIAEDNVRKKQAEKLKNAEETSTDDVTLATRKGKINDWAKEALKKIEERFKPQYSDLESEQKNEEVKVEQDLAKAANDVVAELRKRKDGSYLGQLREEYQNAIWRRDTATSKEDAKDAANEAADINRRLSKAMAPTNRLQQILGITGSIGQGVNMLGKGVDIWRQNTLMEIGELNSAANGDAFGAAQQDLERRRMTSTGLGGIIGSIVGGIVGGIGAAFGSFGVGTAAGIGGGAVAGGALGTAASTAIFNWTHAAEEASIKLGQMWQQQEQRIQKFNSLAIISRGITGNSLTNEREWLMQLLNSGNNGYSPGFIGDNGSHVTFTDLGYTSDQASEIMAQRIKQRGFIGNSSNYTVNGIPSLRDSEFKRAVESVALERVYNMSEGSLGQYSSYDRYGAYYKKDGTLVTPNNANQDMANLVASLNREKVLGMSGGQTLRANEFLGYQTQLMEMQKGWMDAPNAQYATRLLLAGQKAFGNNFDSRAINEISQIENTVTRPKEDYSKALLYDVIQEVMPETKGNLLAIRQAQYSDDPNVRMRIQQRMANRIQEVYGGLDTTSGYLAASHYYGIEDPKRLKALLNQYKKGLPTVATGNIQSDIEPMKEYTPEVSKEMLQYQDATILEISSKLSSLEGVATRILNDFNKKLQDIIDDLPS